MPTPVRIGRKVYPSMAHAARALGLTRAAVSKRAAAGTATRIGPSSRGRAPKPPGRLKRLHNGCREVKVPLPAAVIARFDRRAEQEGTSRNKLLAECAEAGLRRRVRTRKKNRPASRR